MNCACPIRPGMDYEDLSEIIRSKKMCTSNVGTHICPILDRELRRADGERMRRNYYQKRLRKAGLTAEEIAANPPRRRGRLSNKSFDDVELDLG